MPRRLLLKTAMKAAYWSMIGLCFDVVGASFLSVEAIKIDNLRKLREKLLEPLHKATLSPTIRIAEPGEKLYPLSFRERFILANKFSAYITLHYVAGFLLLVAVNFLLRGILLQLARPAYGWIVSLHWWFLIPLGLGLLVGALFVLFTLGELVHKAITRLSLIFVRFFEFIEHKTTSGVVGLIGFALLLLGFVLQFYGTYAGIPATTK